MTLSSCFEFEEEGGVFSAVFFPPSGVKEKKIKCEKAQKARAKSETALKCCTNALI